jgi:regulator of sirC expression with transglutaminase-like and TPR domain
MSQLSVLEEFAQLVAPGNGDEGIDLVAAVLAIAASEYPKLDQAAYRRRFDELAQRVRNALPAYPEPAQIIATVNRVLFDEEGFRGNREDYYDRRNSYINDVLDRKLGIPITLALVYMEVARRVGLVVSGVGMPGHFLLKFFDIAGQEALLDVYERGRVLSPGECQTRLDQIYAGKVSLQPEFLQTVNKRQMLTRMLNNLKNIYLTARDFRRALTVIDMILAIYPRSAEEVRQRALLRYNVGQMRGAVEDLQLYLNMAPDASDADDMRQLALSIRRTLIQMN